MSLILNPDDAIGKVGTMLQTSARAACIGMSIFNQAREAYEDYIRIYKVGISMALGR